MKSGHTISTSLNVHCLFYCLQQFERAIIEGDIVHQEKHTCAINLRSVRGVMNGRPADVCLWDLISVGRNDLDKSGPRASRFRQKQPQYSQYGQSLIYICPNLYLVIIFLPL